MISTGLRARRAASATMLLSVLGAVVFGGGAPVAAADSASEPLTLRVGVVESPASDTRLVIDADLYLPSTTAPSPAVLLAHGFGASKDSLASDARRLQGQGFVVMTYSARGFGDSGGQISLDAVDREVADASALLDVLEGREEVQKIDGDPVVGVVGASYGGALALMLGATDDRIDTVVAAITWNDLSQALVPRSPGAAGGVFKEAWAAQLFGAAASPRSGACGRFTAELCRLYTGLIDGEQLDAADRELLGRSSPSTVLSAITAPTLLLQGLDDTLFGLDQADANARQIAAAGAPVQVAWFSGGHDAPESQLVGTTEKVDGWLAEHLRDAQPETDVALPFEFQVPDSSRTFAQTRVARSYPGIDGGSAGAASSSSESTTRDVRLRGRDQRIVNPPGGVPATTTFLPGVGSIDALLTATGGDTGPSRAERAQGAAFFSSEFTQPFVLVGAPTIRVEVAAASSRDGTVPAGAPTEALLFAELRVAADDSSVAVGGGGVSPIRVPLPADGASTTVEVTLPAASWRFEPGDRLLLLIRTTDSLYQGSPAAASFVVDTDGSLELPAVVSGDPVEQAGLPAPGTLIGIVTVLVVALVLGIIAAVRGRRKDRQQSTFEPRDTQAAPPLVIRGLTKDYRSGLRAVDDLSFAVQRGQVLGLLGPNGAGKTTALRMVTGLLRPDAGEIEIFGERIEPGARVLTRVGCFIEGPGFLPHLSGRRNLELYWAASGRPLAEARLTEALEIADLGTAIKRRVGGYSQGMRQRLAIAQAMLGMPELLILDEPTNGLDPPQIHALRGVLRRYAESGRTVIVSSHLLGEVEQTCSDVVVMAHGRLIAAGTVAELAGDSTELTIEVTDVDVATTTFERLGGIRSRLLAPDTLRLDPGPNSVESVISALTAAGVGVRSVVRGRHLEETFLAMVGAEEMR